MCCAVFVCLLGCAKTKHMPIDLLFLDEEIESKNYFMPNLQVQYLLWKHCYWLQSYQELEMDDDNGLELSLGLSLGGSSGKAKPRDAPLEPKAESQVEENSSKGVSQTHNAPFGKYHHSITENQEHNSKQRHSPIASQFGSFWGQPGSSSAPVVDGYV
ncbi:hypothetical protein U9M48_032619 [Paspalum notatum var. saurae]|uniref:Ethylene-responsive binding factor-associated repression domain-containing protein n=1 Tax=Paspalum notatum var. saurae TaxID=547442 RepID=A0AAQ3U939_PASNO